MDTIIHPNPPAEDRRLDDLIPIKEVMRIAGGISQPTIFRLRQRGQFPEPIRLSPGRCAWSRREIAAWIESRRAQRVA